MIKSIRLLNWRSHSDSKLEFRKGTNLLVGIMGAGKSSILEGISFALFGTFPALERRKLKLEHIVRLNEPFAKVVLEFEWAGAGDGGNGADAGGRGVACTSALFRVERTIERTRKGSQTGTSSGISSSRGISTGTSTSISSTSTSAELYKNNSLIEHGSVAVTAYIKNLTGVDYDLFTRAIYSEQNNIDYFLTLDPRRRKEEIDALLGLDSFELARSNIVTVINKVHSKAATLMERFNRGKVTELESKEKTQSETKAALESSLLQLASSYEVRTKEAAALFNQFNDMKKSKDASERLGREELRFSTQVESLKMELDSKKLERLDGKPVDEGSYKALEARLQAGAAERNACAASVKSIEEKLRLVSKESGIIEARIKSAQDSKARYAALTVELATLLSYPVASYPVAGQAASSQIASSQTADSLAEMQKQQEAALFALESEKKSLEREIADITEALQKLKPGLSECPLCASKLSEDAIPHIKAERDSLIKQKRGRIAELVTLIASGKKENESLLARVRRISLISEHLASMNETMKLEIGSGDDHVGDHDSDGDRAGGSDHNGDGDSKDKVSGVGGASTGVSAIGSLQFKKARLDSEITSILEEKKAAQAKLDSISDELEQLRTDVTYCKNILVKHRELQEIEKKLVAIRNELSAMKFDAEKFEGLRAEAERARMDVERLASSKSSSETQLRMASDMLRLIREELVSLRAIESEIKELASLEEQLSIYRNALLETQVSLRLSLADAINNAMNEIWSMFYPYRNYRALRLGVSEKDYVFEVDDGSGSWRSLEIIASGGERACAALALRVALAMVLTPKLSWLILDEPTHNLDAEAVQLLSSALQFKVPEVVNQTFVITHDEAFMGSEFASSYRLVRDKGRNGETKIESA